MNIIFRKGRCFIIYLDNASTTQPSKETIEIINATLKNAWYNPSGLYGESEYAKVILEHCRKEVLDFIKGRKDDKIIFTSSGCESNSLALNGNYTILYDPTSHSSILDKCIALGDKCKKLKVKHSGYIDTDELISALLDLIGSNEVILVTICWGNNETGVIQSLKGIEKAVNYVKCVANDIYDIDMDIKIHVDATQYIATNPINVKEYDIDLMTISGHKLGTPCGIACLYVRDGVEITPLIYGKQEYRLRGGTENLPYIVAFSEVLKNYDYDSIEDIRKIRNYFLEKLTHGLGYTGSIIGGTYSRLDNHIAYMFDNTDAMGLALYLDVYDIQVSNGSACNTLVRTPSKALMELGYSEEETYQILRFTLSKDITYEEIDEVVRLINQYFEREKSRGVEFE